MEKAPLIFPQALLERAVAFYPVFPHVPPPGTDPRAVYLASLAPGSRRAMAGALDTMSNWLGRTSCAFPWHRVRRAHADAIRARLQAEYAPATANRFLAALRGVLRAARRLGQMKVEDFELAVAVERVRGARLPRGRALVSSEVRALFAACDPSTKHGARDAALLAMLYGTGLRRAEVVALDLEHMADDGSIRVLGKGNAERLVHVTGGARRALDRWLAVRGSQPGPLFLPITLGGRILVHRLNEQAVYTMVKRLARRANVASFSPHDCRRTFISDLLELGVDISTVQRMAGHRDVTTTAKYDRRPEQAKRRAAAMLHVPYYDPS